MSEDEAVPKNIGGSEGELEKILERIFDKYEKQDHIDSKDKKGVKRFQEEAERRKHNHDGRMLDQLEIVVYRLIGNLEEQVSHRQKMLRWILGVVTGWLILVLVNFLLLWLGVGNVTETLILGLLGTFGVSVISLAVIVAKYLFPNGGGNELDVLKELLKPKDRK